MDVALTFSPQSEQPRRPPALYARFVLIQLGIPWRQPLTTLHTGCQSAVPTPPVFAYHVLLRLAERRVLSFLAGVVPRHQHRVIDAAEAEQNVSRNVEPILTYTYS